MFFKFYKGHTVLVLKSDRQTGTLGKTKYPSPPPHPYGAGHKKC